MTMTPRGVLLSEAALDEVKSDWLFHTTSNARLESIANSRSLRPGGSRKSAHSFVSLSAKPLAPGFGHVVLVFRKRSIADRLIKVEYTKDWLLKYPKHAIYIGADWRSEASERASAAKRADLAGITGAARERFIVKSIQADLNSVAQDFARAYKSEEEWITKQPGESMPFKRGELVAILASDPYQDDLGWLRHTFRNLLPPNYVIDLKTGMHRIRIRTTLEPLRKGQTDPLPRDLLKMFGRASHARSAS